jgi:hypothetical protein
MIASFRWFVSITALGLLGACSSAPPEPPKKELPPYHHQASVPECANAQTFIELRECEDDVAAGIQKEANTTLGQVESANVYIVHRQEPPNKGPSPTEKIREAQRIERVMREIRQMKDNEFTKNCASYTVEKGMLVCVPGPPN